MALATRCPSCNTIFRISTAQAAAKGGMVRCGHCRNVFNSLDLLVRVEDLEVIDEVSVEPAYPPATVGAGRGTPPDADRFADEHDPFAEGAATVVEQAVERAVVGPWWLPEKGDTAATRAAPAAEPEAAVSTTLAPSLREDAAPLLSGRRTDFVRDATDLEGTGPTFMRPAGDPLLRRRGTRWLLGAATLLAAVALLAQGVYRWRDELAVRWSPARPWLVAACRPLRCEVGYPTHIDAITIEAASIQASGPNLDVYVMTALLRNRDAVALRYPYLELVLTDLQDRPILRRVLRPEDYLRATRDGGRTAGSGFPAESELPIRVMFELSDLRFAGYRLDRFYP